VLLRSAARSWGARTIAIVLSGSGRDGAAGVLAVAAAGGVCIAQEPGSAGCGGMPESAVATGAVSLVLAPDRIGPELAQLPQINGMTQVRHRTPRTSDWPNQTPRSNTRSRSSR
jgi:chemotaxis response regulator CheB